MDKILKVDIVRGVAFLKRLTGDFRKESEIEVLLLPLRVNRLSEILKKGVHTGGLFRRSIPATRTIPPAQSARSSLRAEWEGSWEIVTELQLIREL